MIFCYFYCSPIALIVVRLVMSFTFVCGGIYGLMLLFFFFDLCLNVIYLGDCLCFAFFAWIRWLRIFFGGGGGGGGGRRRLLTSILDWYATKLT